MGLFQCSSFPCHGPTLQTSTAANPSFSFEHWRSLSNTSLFSSFALLGGLRHSSGHGFLRCTLSVVGMEGMPRDSCSNRPLHRLLLWMQVALWPVSRLPWHKDGDFHGSRVGQSLLWEGFLLPCPPRLPPCRPWFSPKASRCVHFESPCTWHRIQPRLPSPNAMEPTSAHPMHILVEQTTTLAAGLLGHSVYIERQGCCRQGRQGPRQWVV